MSNYPPGVTGNEPQITGEWPCDACDGTGGSKEDGPCELCKGTGIYPEEAWPLDQIQAEIRKVWDASWGDLYFDTDDECLCIHTDLKIIRGSVVLHAWWEENKQGG